MCARYVSEILNSRTQIHTKVIQNANPKTVFRPKSMSVENNAVQLDLDPDLYGDGYKDPFVHDEEKLTIAELIPAILLQRQLFLNISEEELEKEIQQAAETRKTDETETYTESINGEKDEGEETVDSASDAEVFQTQKHQLAAHLNSALNETSLSLDFVSLLISGAKPAVGKSTMSPHLIKNVPLGSLSADRLSVDPEAPVANNTSNTLKLGYGWKQQTLKHITDLFKTASIRLREQIDKEKRYWNMINTALSNDEVLFKTRDPATGSRALGVKYGYGDSGSSYHDKGLAILRKDEQSGEISFHPVAMSTNGSVRITSKVFKYTRVKILSKIDDDYMLTGQSLFDTNSIKTSGHKIVSDIEKARFFLFEEDLFYYLTREAKTLINYNVSIISDKILIEINNEIIEIESVVYDENNEDELSNLYQNINSYSSINNSKAESILTFLKLMLCCFFNYNLKLKQKVPTAMAKWKQNNSHPLILRPLLGHIRHEINCKNMAVKLKEILDHPNVADKIKYDIQTVKYANLVGDKEDGKEFNAFRKLVEIPLSTFVVTVQKLGSDKHLKISIEITATEIFANLAINLSIIKYDDLQCLTENAGGNNVLQISFTDLNDIEDSLNWKVLNFLDE